MVGADAVEARRVDAIEGGDGGVENAAEACGGALELGSFGAEAELGGFGGEGGGVFAGGEGVLERLGNHETSWVYRRPSPEPCRTDATQRQPQQKEDLSSSNAHTTARRRRRLCLRVGLRVRFSGTSPPP
jgi:hypothetical protein